MEIPLWINVILAILLSIPTVRAFPATGASYYGSGGHTVVSSFRFAKIPYKDSVQHIHTLEHLESISAGEYFRIRRVCPPMRYGQFVALSTECVIQGVNHTICLLSRPDQNNQCTYMCLHGSLLRAQVKLQVRPCNRSAGARPHHGDHLLLRTAGPGSQYRAHRALRVILRGDRQE